MKELTEALERVLKAYKRYYSIKDTAPAPFSAYAEFHMSEEQTFLTRNVRLAESESREYVYFFLTEELTPEIVRDLSETAWKEGMSHIVPQWGQKGSDVILVILTKRLQKDAEKLIPLMHYSRSSMLALRGWSNFRLIAMELPSGRSVSNRLGKALREILYNNIFSKGMTQQ